MDGMKIIKVYCSDKDWPDLPLCMKNGEPFTVEGQYAEDGATPLLFVLVREKK